MPADVLARGMFYWLRAPRNYADIRHNEWILTFSRLVLCMCCVSARAHETRVRELYGDVAGLYLIYGLLIILLLRTRRSMHPAAHAVIHLLDILWVANLIALLEWPAIQVVLFYFILTATAVRWGFCEAQLTTLLFSLILPGAHALYDLDLFGLLSGQNLFALLPEVLLYVSLPLMVGFLAEMRAVRSEDYAIEGFLKEARPPIELESAVGSICSKVLPYFHARQILIACDDKFCGDLTLLSISSPRLVLETSPIDPDQRQVYFFRKEGDGVPADFRSAHPFRRVLTASADLDELAVRAFVIDPAGYYSGRAGRRFLRRVVDRSASVIHDLFLVDRSKTEIQAEVKSHVARELHDGVIQSLAGINLQIERLRFRLREDPSGCAAQLAAIQKTVRDEIATLREMMQQLRSFEIDSGTLLSFLSGMAVKFQLEYGISARFVSGLNEVVLRPSVCAELARIVQEALVNVRKHSSAREVLVRLDRSNGTGVLDIIDDGKGFGFSGRFTHEELQASGKGPVVLMERARMINGRLKLESFEGKGSWLQVTFPYQEHP